MLEGRSIRKVKDHCTRDCEMLPSLSPKGGSGELEDNYLASLEIVSDDPGGQ